MTAPEWRDCADPDELAAAVAAGVEVLRMRNRGEWSRSVLSEPKDFAFRIGRGDRYRVPDGWSPEPPADDLRERIARAAAGGYMRVPIVALDGMYLGPPWLDVADAVLAVLPTPPPVPPWPGAVLSGLTDEDGVPTWLAQAGQVRGEQVRIWHDEPWVTTHGSWADSRWVEVRAPRAVPAAPVTERVEPVTVRFYEAFGPTDFTDGRGPRKSMGVYPTEQEAWDSINDLPGVQGTHPSKGNTHPLRSREYEDCGPVLTWQRYREVVGRSGDYYVVERQVVGTPLKATP